MCYYDIVRSEIKRASQRKSLAFGSPYNFFLEIGTRKGACFNEKSKSEHYGNGYIKNKLYKHDTEIDFKTDPNTQDISDVIFDTSLIMAIPFSLSKSIKFEGREASLIGAKVDAFDSLDEAWSQWMDALRAGRSRTYIPEVVLPRNPETGQICKPNAFDNRYIAGGNDMSENARNEISVQQPNIPYDGYMATYITALEKRG